MIKNYLKIALRSMIRHRSFTLINILGLALGMAVFLLIMQYVSFEWSFDRFHEKLPQIYRVYNDRFQEGKLIQHGTITYPRIGPQLYEDYPEVTAYTRLSPLTELVISYQDEVFRESESYFGDPHFFEVFSFEVLAGDPKSSLSEIMQIAISARLAKQIFGVSEAQYETVIGKQVLLFQDKIPFKVTSIFADFPNNSHLQAEAFLSYASFIKQTDGAADQSWTWSDFYHYIELQPGTDPKKFEEKLVAFSDTYFKGNAVSGSEERFYLQPLADAHLYSDFEYEIAETSNGKAIWALFLIGIFVLSIAWINYINLSTARTLQRALEVGIRKVLGAHRHQLIWQFLGEALIFNLFALILAVTAVQLLQVFFSQWVGYPLSLAILWGEGLGGSVGMLSVLVFLLVGSFISGYYPARLLATYTPINTLKGSFIKSKKGIFLRKSLVIVQFTCSVLMLIATFTVFGQLNYMQDKKLGTSLDQILVIENPIMANWDSTFFNNVNVLKHELAQIPGVQRVASSHSLMGIRLPRLFSMKGPLQQDGQVLSTSFLHIDLDFVPTYELSLIAGRNFTENDHSFEWEQVNTILLNRSATQLLGYTDPQEALEQTINFWGKKWRVVGILEDFHQRSLHNPIEPLTFIPGRNTSDNYSVRLSAQELPAILPRIQSTYERTFPGSPFQYFFMDDRFAEQYRDDQRFGELFTVFALLAVFIACLGIIGLTLFSTLQRNKEVGIRKILGASPMHLIQLLSKESIILVLAANLLAIPVAYWGIHVWISNYAYQMPLSVFLFVWPALLILLIAFLSTFSQVIKSVNSNPVESLRQE